MDANFIRGFLFTQAAFVFLMTLAIVVQYSMQLTIAPKEDRAKPWHILLIGLSYLWAVVYICIEIRLRWGQPITWRSPNAAGIFILGDAALIMMLSHLTVQRKFMNEIRAAALLQLSDEKRELADELKRQTSGLAQMIKKVGEKADGAYHEAGNAYNEANDANSKIAGLQEIIENNQMAGRDQIQDISAIGTDTNERVRRIEPVVTKAKDANK